MTFQCRSCRGKVNIQTDFRAQPISNRYLDNPLLPEYLHSLVLGTCQDCDLVQLTALPPDHELRPRVDWIKYNEPESHLESVADEIKRISKHTSSEKVLGISYKDDSLIQRLNERGYLTTNRLDMRTDLAIEEVNAGMETIQSRLSAPEMKSSDAEIIIARHILEHAFDLKAFIEGIKRLGTSDAHIIFEVPDCSKIFQYSDYSFIWEEHVVYFTEETLRTTLLMNGLDVIDIKRYTYPTEDSLVAITKPSKANHSPVSKVHNSKYFNMPLEAIMPRYHDALSPFKGSAVLFGSGHLAVTFLNLYNLAPYFDCVIDDNPNKRGLYMPGSKLPIRGSEVLSEGQYKLCVLTLSPESTAIVTKKYSFFSENGGRFVSAFQSAQNSLI